MRSSFHSSNCISVKYVMENVVEVLLKGGGEAGGCRGQQLHPLAINLCCLIKMN